MWTVLRRVAWLVLWLVVTAAVVFEVGKHGFVNGGLGEAAVLLSAAVSFFVLPDLTFLIGVGDEVESGNLSRKAVPYYNALHRIWVPLLLACVVGVAFAPLTLGMLALFVGGLAWIAHICLDRAFGYGLRNADGSR